MAPSAFPDPTQIPASPPFGRGRPTLDTEEMLDASLSPGVGHDGSVKHPGCWGAGGWASSSNSGAAIAKGAAQGCSVKRLGGDPWQAQDAQKVKSTFRRLLLRRYHTMTAAWRGIDPSGRGRISFFEICRACRDLGYEGSVRILWASLDEDRDGFVSLHEVDPDVATLLEGFAVCIWASCGSVEKAWKKHFNKRGAARCDQGMFLQGCQEIGYAGDIEACYNELNSDLGTTGLCKKEWSFLELWFAQGEPKPIDVHHDKAIQEMTARLGDDRELKPPPKLDIEAEVRAFKKLLLQSYGNYVRAWRQGLDRDHSGVLDYEEFRTACQDLGYPGARMPLWRELDGDGSGGCSLSEIDKPTSDMLQRILECALKRYSSWEEMWKRLMDTRGNDRVDLFTFIKGCRALGWGGNAERLFELLDIDKANYLAYGQTAWLAGEEEEEPVYAEEVGGQQITGKFKQQTKGQERKTDLIDRERRMAKAKVDATHKAVIPGTEPGAKHLPLQLRRSQTVASSLMPIGNAHPLQKALAAIPHGMPPKHTLSHSASEPMKGSRAYSDKEKLTQSLHSFAGMSGRSGGMLGASTKSGSAMRSMSTAAMTPASPGKGGWPSSKQGLARMANRDFREELVHAT